MAAPIKVITDAYSIVNVVANDSDKTILLDGKRQSTVIGIRVDYTASATVATRQVVVEFLDSAGNTILEARAGATQAASEARIYQFGVGLSDMSSFIDTNFLTTPIPPVPMSQVDSVRVFDSDATGIATDDMLVSIVCAW